jgi:hypothetical protein
MMLSDNVVHLTLFRMGTLLVKSYGVYCRILDKVWLALATNTGMWEQCVCFWVIKMVCNINVVVDTDRGKSLSQIDCQDLYMVLTYDDSICN